MPLSDDEVMSALQGAMESIGMTLMRTRPSPFERALAHQVEQLVARKAAGLQAPCAGQWWLAGPVIGCDEKPITVRIEGDFETPEEQRQYLAALCELMNRAASLPR